MRKVNGLQISAEKDKYEGRNGVSANDGQTLAIYNNGSLFVRPVAEPGQRGNLGLIQPVVSQRNHVQILSLIENCL